MPQNDGQLEKWAWPDWLIVRNPNGGILGIIRSEIRHMASDDAQITPHAMITMQMVSPDRRAGEVIVPLEALRKFKMIMPVVLTDSLEHAQHLPGFVPMSDKEKINAAGLGGRGGLTPPGFDSKRRGLGGHPKADFA